MNVIWKESWKKAVIPTLAIFNICFHLVFSANLGYHRDELLYFSLGQHPAAGYETVPPLIGLSAWMMQSLFGYSVYAVRLMPALFSGIMIFIVAAISRQLGGSKYAEFLSAIGLTVSIFFMRSFSLFQPVFMEILLWTLCIYFLVRYVNTNKNSLLIFFGLTAGMALLNKYLAILLFAGLLIIIPFTRYRFIFRNRIFWFGILLGFLVFSPNLLWQVLKGFPVLNHMSELYDTQLVHMDVSLFLSEQILMPFAGTAFTVAGLVYLLFSKSAEKFRFLGFL
jgi:4-amino-4-deoxy-L-arabinose transferase-like glycosyltransferase